MTNGLYNFRPLHIYIAWFNAKVIKYDETYSHIAAFSAKLGIDFKVQSRKALSGPHTIARDQQAKPQNFGKTHNREF
jgi:hypothetical protein